MLKTVSAERASLLLLLQTLGFGNFRVLVNMIREDTDLLLISLWFSSRKLPRMTTFQFQTLLARYSPR